MSTAEQCKAAVKAAHDEFKKAKGDKNLVDMANEIMNDVKDETVADFIKKVRSSHGWWYRKRIALYKTLNEILGVRSITKKNGVIMKDGKNLVTSDKNASRKMSDVLTPENIKKVQDAKKDTGKVVTAWEDNMKDMPQCKDIVDPTKAGQKVGILTKIWGGVKALAYAIRECSVQQIAADMFLNIIGYGFTKIAEMMVNLLTGFLGTLGKIIYFGAKAVYYFFQAYQSEEDDSKAAYYGKGVGASIRVIMSIFGAGKRKALKKQKMSRRFKKQRKYRKH